MLALLWLPLLVVVPLRRMLLLLWPLMLMLLRWASPLLGRIPLWLLFLLLLLVVVVLLLLLLVVVVKRKQQYGYQKIVKH